MSNKTPLCLNGLGLDVLYVIRGRENKVPNRQSYGSNTAILYSEEGLRRALRHLNLNNVEVVRVSIYEDQVDPAQRFLANPPWEKDKPSSPPSSPPMSDAELAQHCLALCNRNEWKRSWGEGGCALHLEVSEFIEAIRGKGNSSVVEEAGDVLFVLYSMLAHRKVSIRKVKKFIQDKVSRLLKAEPYRKDEVGE